MTPWQVVVAVNSVSVHPLLPFQETLHPDSPTPKATERCESRLSLMSAGVEICRICHCESEPDAPLMSPCLCAGSMKYVHQTCLQKWIKSSENKACELCKYDFVMSTKVKPFREVSATTACAPASALSSRLCRNAIHQVP